MATERNIWTSIRRGFRNRCPKCNQGRILHGYLKVHDHCPHCAETFSHHRADDGPAYLTILVVGHLMAPVLHVMYVHYRPDPLTLFTTISVGCVALSLYLLPRLKGAMIGFQWARRMGGFGTAEG